MKLTTCLLCLMMIGPTEIFAQNIVIKKTLDTSRPGPNLLQPDAWAPWDQGFTARDGVFRCDNGTDATRQSGLSQRVTLNQQRPLPIVAEAWSRAENVGGSKDNSYALYIDLVYADGTALWGQTAAFNVGTHDWEKQQVMIYPDKPVHSLTVYLLLRSHTGRALFRQPKLWTVSDAPDSFRFDGVPVSGSTEPYTGFSIRDVAAESDILALVDKQAMGVQLSVSSTSSENIEYLDVQLTDLTGQDRALTLYYSQALPPEEYLWLKDPRQSEAVDPAQEYMYTSTQSVGANGRLSKYPFAAVSGQQSAYLLGIDLGVPAFYRVGFNGPTHELFIAYDIGLCPEKTTAHLRFCRAQFDPQWGFRAALDLYYQALPQYFVCRTPQQGLWMPFAHIGDVRNWQDFGFKFKEGNSHTTWDDAHDMLTLRYTEPMTWWMSMPPNLPRTLSSAQAHAQDLADQGKSAAQAFLTSAYHDSQGEFTGKLLNRPWNDGTVWSVNSMPGIAGVVTDFKNKWNPALRQRLYGPERKGDLDGEYVDSSEGYVTDELDFRREHFAATQTPLTFARDSRQVGIFRGLIAFEYIRALAQDVHAMDKLMMANSTPHRLCFLAAHLDIMGTETNWNPNAQWRPLPDEELLYIRAICKGKPYCFLMNTPFEQFSHALVETYMQRSLAYGMFPGFFSHNAAQGHYFQRPELYERDRDLFLKYVPLCKRVAEAGWEPITHARTDSDSVYVERFGKRYLTVFNDSPQRQHVLVSTDFDLPNNCQELISAQSLTPANNTLALTLQPETVAVIDLQ
jgi:hypothetical protein